MVDSVGMRHTVKPLLKDHPIGHKRGLSRQVVFGDRFNYSEIYDFLRRCGLRRQVACHGSGLSRQVFTVFVFFRIVFVPSCKAVCV